MKWQQKGNTADTWYANLDERQLAEVDFARLYAEKFEHGTDGHHRLLIIAKLAGLLDGLQSRMVMSLHSETMLNQTLVSMGQTSARSRAGLVCPHCGVGVIEIPPLFVGQSMTVTCPSCKYAMEMSGGDG